MNRRIVSGLLGYLTLFCGAAMVPPFILATFEREFDGAAAFLLSIFYVWRQLLNLNASAAFKVKITSVFAKALR